MARHYGSHHLTIYVNDSFEVQEKKVFEALEAHPECKAEYYCRLSAIYNTVHKYKKAFHYIQLAIDHALDDEDRADYYIRMSHLYSLNENDEEAIKCVLKAIELDPEEMQWIVDLGRLYKQTGEYEKAVDTFGKLLTMKDRDGGNYQADYDDLMLELAVEQEDFSDAKQHYFELLHRDNVSVVERAEALKKLSELFEKEEDYEMAIAHAKLAFDLCPDQLTYIARLSESLLKDEQYEEAISIINLIPALGDVKGMEHNRKWYLRYYYGALANVYQTMEDEEKEMDCYIKQLENITEPNTSYSIYQNITGTYCANREYDKAKPYLEQMMKFWPMQYPRVYTAMAMYYFDMTEDFENALNYFLLASQANGQTEENVKGEDAELAFTIYKIIGMIYNKNPDTEDEAIVYFKKALECNPNQEQEGSICTELYHIYGLRGDEKNAELYKEKRDGISILKDMFNGDWTPPPPKTLEERNKQAKNTEEEIKNLPYHFSKIPADSKEQAQWFKDLHQHFEADLLTNPKYKEFFAAYDPFYIKDFIYHYVKHKVQLVKSHQWYANEEETVEETVLRTDTEELLELILHKKLFNMQVLWRAEKINIAEIKTTHDFSIWDSRVFECPFIEEITPNEIAVMKQFLLDSNFSDDTMGFFTGWQDYEKMMEKNKEGDREYMPEWYEFYDGRMGTGTLLVFPDIRGKKEQEYIDAYWKWKNKQPVPPAEPAAQVKHLSPLFANDENYMKFMEEFEDDYLCKFHQKWYQSKTYKDKDGNWEEVWEAMGILQGAGKPIYLEGGMVWQDAIVKAAKKYKNEQLYNNLDDVYDNYRMKRQLNLYFSDEEQHKKNNKPYTDMQEWILKGRELQGEPRDFDF